MSALGFVRTVPIMVQIGERSRHFYHNAGCSLPPTPAADALGDPSWLDMVEAFTTHKER